MSEPTQRKIRNDIVAVLLLGLIVFLIASLATYDPADQVSESVPVLTRIYQPDQLIYPANAEIQNACGRFGAWTSDMLVHVLGVGAYYLVLGLVCLEIALFRARSMNSPWVKTVGWIVSLVGLAALGSLVLPTWTISPVIGAGGYLGALASGLMQMNVGYVGALIIALSVSLVGLMMWTEYLVFRAGRLVFTPTLVAASRLLPFGIAHGFFTWFNSLSDPEVHEDEEEYEDEIAEEDEEDGEAPRTIRIRRRGMDSDGDQVTEVTAMGQSVAEEEDGELEDEFEEDVESAVDEPIEAEEQDEEFEEEDEEEEESPMTIPLVKGKALQEMIDGEDEEEEDEDEEEVVAAATAPSTVPQKPHFKVRDQQPPKKTEREEVMEQLDNASMVRQPSHYDLPAIDLLSRGGAIDFEIQERQALAQAQVLEQTCREFGYEVKVVEIETGPVISQFELDLEPGLRLAKIVALEPDLAIKMRVPSVRIVPSIPGKNTVGVEVPNKTRQIVHLRGVMEQSEKQINKMKIPLFLGKDAVGAPMVADLAALPHLLIAGRTGTGKSVALNAIITSILMTRRPDEVRMLMIDPKMVELSGYNKLPHLMHPVVTDMRKAEAILAWAVDKMEERYKLLARAGVRHLTSYNQLSEEERLERLQPANDAERKAIPDYLPFIVIVADEMADLMMTAGKEVEAHIIRLAQKSRAVGIHLILATQKPTVDVITGLIKSNLPARIAFQVASKTDSRVVLDAMGADKLLGMGDMLFLQPGTSSLLRGQGTYLSDPEIDAITDSCSTGEQNFVSELVNLKISDDKEEEDSGKQVDNSRDDLYEKAVDVIVREQRGSVSLLQRNLGIGYGRSARLIDYMAEDGIVGPYNGSKAREVLIGPGQWEAMKAGGGSESTGESEDVETVVSESAASVAVEPAVAVKRSKPKKTLLKRDAVESASAGTHLAASSAPVVEPIDEVESDEDLEGTLNEDLQSANGINGGVAVDAGEEPCDEEYEEEDLEDEEYDEEDYEEESDEVVASVEDEAADGEGEEEYEDEEYEDVEDGDEEYEDVDEENDGEEYEEEEYDDDEYEYEDADDYENVE